jgi:hypothetical protein
MHEENITELGLLVQKHVCPARIGPRPAAAIDPRDAHTNHLLSAAWALFVQLVRLPPSKHDATNVTECYADWKNRPVVTGARPAAPSPQPLLIDNAELNRMPHPPSSCACGTCPLHRPQPQDRPPRSLVQRIRLQFQPHRAQRLERMPQHQVLRFRIHRRALPAPPHPGPANLQPRVYAANRAARPALPPWRTAAPIPPPARPTRLRSGRGYRPVCAPAASSSESGPSRT